MVADVGQNDHLQWETIRERIIRSGTVERLVESLVGSDNMMDSRHFNVFFATYRAFTNAGVVLKLLIDRYECLWREPCGPETTHIVIQNSIRSVLLCWMDMYPEDFYEPLTDFASLCHLIDFARTNKLVDLRLKAKRLKEAHKRLMAEGGPIAQLPSMHHYIFARGCEHPGADLCPQNPKVFDIGKENCVQIAEQLTFWDAALFKELLPQHCQGCVWSQRHKKGHEAVYTVKATIDQFNAVAERVMTSIVLPECKADFRAKIISKWIDIARELRALKNFSSLKAVLSSLQSEPVYRLKSVWSHVSSRSMTQFKELASIFSIADDGEEQRVRRILEEEGTAKSSPLRRPQLIQNCRRSKSDVNLAESQGTVPYLGNFLTDLTMIDQAQPDCTDDGLINFEKRRKEFEVIAKIRLFQSAARAYTIPMDPAFCSWFYYLPSLDEKQCFARSLEIEKAPDMTPKTSKSAGLTVHKISTWSKLFSSSNADDGVSNEVGGALGVQSSNDSGIATEDSWISDRGRPPMSRAFYSTLSPYSAVHMSNSYTAPSTPSLTMWKTGRTNLNDSGERKWKYILNPLDVEHNFYGSTKSCCNEECKSLFHSL
ncbi:hypothetical protein AB6A40_001181 [Gnathostoma spinigerum]|uniref:Uncharacterized protein n=1 Tax=Gnathostoma spinigerum TaxID=75299 RepID=A0ABD6E5Q2_9BILA